MAMKSLQKLFVPALLVVIALLIYLSYFGGKKGIGNFSDFDTNNNANKDIRVVVVREKGVNQNASAGTAMFFARDAKGVEYPVQVPLPLPADFNELESVLLKGHLHKDHFHAVEIRQ
jgi:cytochrome c-type biogenesis protein CcmE